MSKKKITVDDNVDTEILQCDTLSTESPSNSFASISPVFDKDNEKDEEKKWLNQQNCKKSLHCQSLNDGIILTQISRSITIPENERENRILVAPSTLEERQNEKFARKVGINL